jgi:hypothetical protein
MIFVLSIRNQRKAATTITDATADLVRKACIQCKSVFEVIRFDRSRQTTNWQNWTIAKCNQSQLSVISAQAGIQDGNI